MAAEERPLSRWARRKAAVRHEAEQVRRHGPGPATPAPGAEEAPQLPDAGQSPPAELPADLPDIDSLTAESDFTVFMRENVPKALRSLALRKLWLSDPIFSHQDGLVEYGEDYTDAARVVEGMKSAWMPGRGYAKEITQSDEQVPDSEEFAGTDEAAEPAAGAGNNSEPVEGEEDVAGGEEGEDTDLG